VKAVYQALVARHHQENPQRQSAGLRIRMRCCTPSTASRSTRPWA
jgi:hypothetical protein